jgi:predicted adenine nucleotide alpha hydrolase (AANH) superfamily ATPase
MYLLRPSYKNSEIILFYTFLYKAEAINKHITLFFFAKNIYPLKEFTREQVLA